MNTKTKIITSILCMITIGGIYAALVRDNSSLKPVISSGQDVTIGVGQTGAVKGFSVTFNRFVQDSRCPIDVQCIQAGAVNINVTYRGRGMEKTLNMPSDEVPQEFVGYKISIIGIQPPRLSKQEIDPGDYHITFHIVQK